jgi:hypothetical protein
MGKILQQITIMNTCKNCFRKYNQYDVSGVLFTSFDARDFCSYVCSEATNKKNEQQREEANHRIAQQRTYDSQQKETNTNKIHTEIILELQKGLDTHRFDLMALNVSFEILMKSLALEENPGWYITQLLDLKKQYESRMRSIDYNYEKTIRDKKAAEEERVRIYNNSPAGKVESAKAAEEKATRNTTRVFFQICWSLILLVTVPANLNFCSNQGNPNHTSGQRASDTLMAIFTFCIIPVSVIGLVATSYREK